MCALRAPFAEQNYLTPLSVPIFLHDTLFFIILVKNRNQNLVLEVRLGKKKKLSNGYEDPSLVSITETIDSASPQIASDFFSFVKIVQVFFFFL